MNKLTDKKLLEHFTKGINSCTLQTVGAEVETHFIDHDGNAVQAVVVQHIFECLVEQGWNISSISGGSIIEIMDNNGNFFSRELGRQTIELSTNSFSLDSIVDVMENCLSQLYEAAFSVEARPSFSPILHGYEDLLFMPEIYGIWIGEKGRMGLSPSARMASVQFTVSVHPDDAIDILNALGEEVSSFLLDYPQDAIWKRYMKRYPAKWLSSRYGGPLFFESFEDYCLEHIQHDVPASGNFVPYESCDVNLFYYQCIVWWHFRLKRYADKLCIEVRPMARREDSQFENQLAKVINIISSV